MKKILFVHTNYPTFLDEFHQSLGERKLSYLQLKRERDKQWFGQEGHWYSRHLQPLGWQGQEVIVNDWKLQSQWARENKVQVQVQEKWWAKNLPESVKNLVGARSWVKQILLAQIKRFKPDVVYLFDLSILGVSDLKQIKKLARLVVAQAACPLPVYQAPLFKYDLIISSFSHYVEKFRRMGIASEYLRWCFETDIWQKIGKLPKKYDIVFIGGFSPFHNRGNQILEELAKKVQVDFWGYGEQYLDPTSAIRNRFHGPAWGRQMYEIIAQAKIVVNRHIDVADGFANNLRMFETTGMGTLLVTEERKNMAEFFNPGKEVVTYRNTTDLINTVKYYLTHGPAREAIARAGQKRTLKDHTYEVRMKELDQILRAHLA